MRRAKSARPISPPPPPRARRLRSPPGAEPSRPSPGKCQASPRRETARRWRPPTSPRTAQSRRQLHSSSGLAHDPCDMAHLAAVTYGSLAVEMHERAGHGEPLLVGFDLSADQIDHLDTAVTHWLAERPARDGPDVLLELRDGCAVDGPMAGIVHARRNLVDQKGLLRSFADDKHFNCEHAHIVKGACDCLGDVSRVGGHGG